MTTLTLMNGDCVAKMKELDDNSIDAILCDPPYGLKFMNKDFDDLGEGKQQKDWHVQWVREAYRVLKPNGVMKAFGGTRTYQHLLAAMAEVGFEVSLIGWVYGSGFPKSLNISKKMDSSYAKKVGALSNALQNFDLCDIMSVWENNTKSDTVLNVINQFQKEKGKGSKNTPKESFVLLGVEGLTITNSRVSPKRSDNVIVVEMPSPSPTDSLGESTTKNDTALELVWDMGCETEELFRAITVELRSLAHPATYNQETIVQGSVDPITTLSQSLVKCVEQSQPNQNHKLSTISIVESCVKEWLNENTMVKIKAEEVLKTLLGKKKSSKEEIISVLCVEIPLVLKHIILSQSKTFQNSDTNSQMECVSAMSVITTKSIMEHLTTSMVAMLKNLGAERESDSVGDIIGYTKGVGGENLNDIVAGKEVRTTDEDGGKGVGAYGTGAKQVAVDVPVREWVTEEAKTWSGWGTSLKPAFEPVCVGHKKV